MCVVPNALCRTFFPPLVAKLTAATISTSIQLLFSSWHPSRSARRAAVNPHAESCVWPEHGGDTASPQACAGHAECQPCHQFPSDQPTNIHHNPGEESCLPMCLGEGILPVPDYQAGFEIPAHLGKEGSTPSD